MKVSELTDFYYLYKRNKNHNENIRTDHNRWCEI